MGRLARRGSNAGPFRVDIVRQTSCTPARAGPAAEPVKGHKLAPDGGTELDTAPLAIVSAGRGCHQVRCMSRIVAEFRPNSSATRASRGSEKPACAAACDHVLESLYRDEHAGLIAYLARRVGAEHASDLAQEVFLRAATSAQLPVLRNPGGFLRRIAYNLLVDEARRRDCRVPTLPLIENIDVPSRAVQEDSVLASEALLAFEAALAQLPEKTARIFAMNRFEQKSYRQIHRELGIALPTVDYHMMKALAHLRGALDRPG